MSNVTSSYHKSHGGDQESQGHKVSRKSTSWQECCLDRRVLVVCTKVYPELEYTSSGFRPSTFTGAGRWTDDEFDLPECRRQLDVKKTLMETSGQPMGAAELAMRRVHRPRTVYVLDPPHTASVSWILAGSLLHSHCSTGIPGSHTLGECHPQGDWPRQEKRSSSGWLVPSPLAVWLEIIKGAANYPLDYSRAPPPLATLFFFSRPGAT
ncbi:13499_t:CDS:1, partial [Acaulospora colombiana]